MKTVEMIKKLFDSLTGELTKLAEFSDENKKNIQMIKEAEEKNKEEENSRCKRNETMLQTTKKMMIDNEGKIIKLRMENDEFQKEIRKEIKAQVKEACAEEVEKHTVDLKLMRKAVQAKEDEYFLKTVHFKNLQKCDWSLTPRQIAYQVLRIIKGDQILHQVKTISFNKARTNMRLVFGSPWEAQVAIKHWVDCKKAVKYSTGRDDPLCFVRMVPKRFREQQQKLYTIGLQMKQSSEIKHFILFLYKSSLVMRVWYKDSKSRIITAEGHMMQFDKAAQKNYV